MKGFKMNELERVLAAREQRWQKRKALVEQRHHCLITISLCLPVEFRTQESYWLLFQQLCNQFWELFVAVDTNACFEGFIRGDDGPAYFVSTECDAIITKKICIDAEKCIPGGRMLDIDVMDRDGLPVGRSDLGLPARKCFICENPAAVCVSRKLHTREEITEQVEILRLQVLRGPVEGKALH
jgi:holo-ACP synthase